MALSDNTNSPATDESSSLGWVEALSAIGGLAITALVLWHWYKTGKIA